MTGEGRKRCANGGAVHEQQRLVVTLFSPGASILMAAPRGNVSRSPGQHDYWPPRVLSTQPGLSKRREVSLDREAVE